MYVRREKERERERTRIIQEAFIKDLFDKYNVSRER